jgi:hypothetical protein
MSCKQGAGRNHNIRSANQIFKNVTKLKYTYFGAKPIYQNFIHEQIYDRLNSENVRYSAVHHLLFHPFSIQRHKVKILRTIIWPVV